jgi:hypothetical protein
MSEHFCLAEESALANSKRMGEHSIFWSLALLATVVLLVRALIFLIDTTQVDVPFDIDRWLETARNIVAGHGYSLSSLGYDEPVPTALRGPTVVYFFATVLWMFGDHMGSILMAQWLVDAATSVVLFFIALEIFRDRRVAFMASLLYAFYLPGLIFTFRGYSEPVFTLTLAGFSLSLLLARRRPALWRFALSGGLLGLATLARPIMQFFPMVLGVLLWWELDYQWRRALRSFAALALAFAAVLAPWVIRNYRVFGAFIPAATHSGGPFLESNFALDQPDYLKQRSSEQAALTLRKILEARFGPASNLESDSRATVRNCESAVERELAKKRPPLLRSERCVEEFKVNKVAKAHGLNEFELSRIAFQETLQVVRAHPGRYVLVSIVRFFRLWFHHRFVQFVILGGKLPRAWSVAALNAVLLGLALTGFLCFRGPWIRSAVCLMVLLAYVSAMYAAAQAVGRYSAPLMPYVMVFSAHALVQLFARRFRKTPETILAVQQRRMTAMS